MIFIKTSAVIIAPYKFTECRRSKKKENIVTSTTSVICYQSVYSRLLTSTVPYSNGVIIYGDSRFYRTSRIEDKLESKGVCQG